MILKIVVSEKIETTDNVPGALKVIEALVRDWISSDDNNPLEITVEKEETRAPPTLGVQAGESVGTKEVFGRP